MALDLNTYLDQARREGRLDSDGQFVLSPEKALEKMRSFQLVAPELYVVHLLAAAVARGATFFRVMTANRSVEFNFDGLPLERDDLDGLFSALLSQASPTWQRELAIGVNGALALEPERVTLDTWASGAGWSLVCQGQEVCLEPRTNRWRPGAGGTRVLVELEFSLQRTLRRLSSTAAELKVLMQMCRYASLALTVDTLLVSHPVSMGAGSNTALARCHLQADPGTPQASLSIQPLQEREAPYCVEETVPSPGDFSALLVLESARKAREHGLTLVVNGVSFRRSQDLLGFPLACGVVSAPFLKKNISQSDLVEDEAYHQLLEQLRQRVQAMVLHRCVCDHPFGRYLGPELAQALEQTYPDRPPEVREWFVRYQILRSGASEEEFAASLATVAAVSEDQAQRLWKELFAIQFELLLESWPDPADTTGRVVQAQRLARLLQHGPLGSPDQRDLVRTTLALEDKPGWSAERLGTEWEDHRLALCHRLAERYDRAEPLHARDQTTAWGPFLLGQLALAGGEPERAVDYFERAQALAPKWAFLYDACAWACERLEARQKAYRQRVRAYELRKPSRGSVVWLQWLAEQSRGAAPFLEWVGWCARAGRVSFQLSLAENELWYGLTRAQSQGLTCWLELVDSNRNLPATSALSSYLFWRFQARLAESGLLAQADQRLCRRLLFGSFQLQDGTVKAAAPPPSLL